MQLTHVRKVYRSFSDLVNKNKEFINKSEKFSDKLTGRINEAMSILEKSIEIFEEEYQRQQHREDHVPIRYQKLVPYNAPKAEA